MHQEAWREEGSMIDSEQWWGLTDQAEVSLVQLCLPLVTPFRTAFGTQTKRDILLIRVKTTALRVG